MRLVYRVHAIERMFQNGIDEEDVRLVLTEGETIKNYPDDMPYPSRLVLGWRDSRPIHVVAADNGGVTTYVITAYEPNPDLWEPDFRRKKP